MIKKVDVEAKLRQTHDEEIKKLEERIDNQLEVKGIPLRISVEGFQKISIDTIQAKYEKEGGYTVVRQFGDQRDPCNDLVIS